MRSRIPPFCLLVVLASAVSIGCGAATAPSPGPTTSVDKKSKLPADDDLKQELDEVLTSTLRNRRLSLDVHRAWQILHGALAYKRDFPVLLKDKEVSAVDHVLAGGGMRGWDLAPVIDTEANHRGLRAMLEGGSKAGQGHPDQWLAVLSQCDLEMTHPIKLGEQEFTLADYVAQVQQDLPHNLRREFSWTLIGLSAYLPTDAKWTASDGEEWSIERLVEIEAEQELEQSACGGTHRLIGMTMALSQHERQQGEITGGWQKAKDRIQEAIEIARRHQNPDGSFSTNYFARPGNSPDLAQNLGVTGHVVEFLALALDDQQLKEPWVQRAVLHMCKLFRKTESIPLECGALYHAAHGLVLYRERVFGPRSYADATASENSGPAAR